MISIMILLQQYNYISFTLWLLKENVIGFFIFASIAKLYFTLYCMYTIANHEDDLVFLKAKRQCQVKS